MHGSKMLPTAALVIVLLFSSLGCSLSYDLVDVEEMLIEAEDFGRSLLQAAATNGAYGGYGNGAYGGYGGYGGYGAQLQSVTYRTECTNQTNPTNLQVFVAMLQPAQPLSNNEAAEGAASGMMTMYVDSRTGQAWVSGDINNIQNLTAVTVNAGNVTESGPVVLPLLPSASDLAVDGTPTPVNNVTTNETLIGALWNATFNSSNNNANGNTAGTTGANGGNTGQTQTPSVTVTGFNPPLPYLTNFMFSQKVYTNATVPLVANATVNNTVSNAGTGATQESAANSYNGQNNGQNNQWANISEIINTLGDGNVTVVTTTKYTVNGSTSDTNITGGNNTSSNNGGQESGSPQGTFNASAYNSTNILALLQSGLAYVSVWTAQSGNNSELRGQVRPYGQVVGASPTIQNAFPDSLVPEATYTTTTCRQVAVPVPRQERAARPNGNANGNNNIRAITTDVYGADVVGNNYTAQAKQTLPGVATAMANITDGDDTNVKGNYSIFAAAVDAAARFVTNNNSNANNAAGAGSAAAATGRHLLQANTGSASTASANGNAAGGANAAGQSALANTGGTGGVTVFAPTNQAITRYLEQANITANELLANKTLLLKVISFHVVPNEAITVNDLAKKKQKTNQLKTLLPNNNVGYRLNQAGTATLFGTAGSSARIVDGNIKSGNVIVQGIDSVLVPPALRSVATAAGKNNESGMTNTAAGGNSNTGANTAGRRLMKLLHLG